MKKDSYPYLISVTVFFLGAVFLLIWWKVTIYRETFLNPVTSRYVILGSLAVSFFISIFMVSKGVVKDGKISAYLKLFCGVSILMVMFSVVAVMTITYFLPGVYSSYTASYTYASGSSKSCSGADVDDPELETNIRICYPDGNYEYNDDVYVEKRSNILGAVVTHAVTFSHNSRE
ncbi:hypothetical protein [Enterobacter hormaechei]|uniref:hypothetical protein n=1 Tax=Enterobacter hormaechei TaxID=158836 RepID=UPI0034CE2A32